MKLISAIRKAIAIITRRIREQGLKTSYLWLYARGIPFITGIPMLKYSRVTPQLFVGPQYRLNGLNILHEAGINAVVNMRIEKNDADFGLAPERYCYLPTVDDDAPSKEHLDEGIKFIRQVIEEGGKVYIHCGAGVGRAPTMAAAYLMDTGLSLQIALSMIRKVRPFIYITPPQMQALIDLQQNR